MTFISQSRRIGIEIHQIINQIDEDQVIDSVNEVSTSRRLENHQNHHANENGMIFRPWFLTKFQLN